MSRDWEKVHRKFVADCRDKYGHSVVEIAEHISKFLKLEAPMHEKTIYKMIDGPRKITGGELAAIADLTGEPIPSPSMQSTALPDHGIDSDVIPIERELRAGVFSEPEVLAATIGVTSAPKDKDFPNSKQTAYIYRGDAMNDIADGDVLLCIDPSEAPAPKEGSLVVIERTERGGLIEMSARSVAVFKDRVEYHSSGKSKPVVVSKAGKKSDDTVRVVAIIRRVTGYRA